MSRTMKIVIAIVVVVVLLGGWMVTSYNRFVRLDQDVSNKWAQIDTQLKRRYDLIPNLVATVKGITGQEQKVFGDLAEARSHYAGASTAEAQAGAANQVEGALARLLVITENYPQLRSSEAFNSLMVQLEGSENRIAVARKDYNDSIQVLDTAIKSFPSNVVARLFGVSERTYFKAQETEKTTPEVKF